MFFYKILFKLFITALTPNAVNCNTITGVGYDQLAAVASALLTNSTNCNTGSNLNTSTNISAVPNSTNVTLNFLNNPNSLTNAVNILDYKNPTNCKELNTGKFI